jgi:hypothetical protein
MVPLISPLLLIDRPGGKPDAVKPGACPAAATFPVIPGP